MTVADVDMPAVPHIGELIVLRATNDERTLLTVRSVIYEVDDPINRPLTPGRWDAEIQVKIEL